MIPSPEMVAKALAAELAKIRRSGLTLTDIRKGLKPTIDAYQDAARAWRSSNYDDAKFHAYQEAATALASSAVILLEKPEHRRRRHKEESKPCKGCGDAGLHLVGRYVRPDGWCEHCVSAGRAPRLAPL